EEGLAPQLPLPAAGTRRRAGRPRLPPAARGRPAGRGGPVPLPRLRRRRASGDRGGAARGRGPAGHHPRSRRGPPRPPEDGRDHDHRRRADAAPAARPHAERLALRHRAPASPVSEPTPGPPFGEEPPKERQTVPFLVLQFFVFPLAIVAVCVAMFVVFGL